MKLKAAKQLSQVQTEKDICHFWDNISLFVRYYPKSAKNLTPQNAYASAPSIQTKIFVIF